jgi:hypothetical protein
MIAKPTFRNGHHLTKGEGDNLWKTKLEHLPAPTPMTAEQAAEAMHTDGCVQFPDLLSPAEVVEMRRWMDSCAGPDEQYEMKLWCFNRHIGARPHQDAMWLKLIDREPAFGCLELILGKRFVCAGGSQWTTGKGRRMGLHVDHQAVSLPEEMYHDPRLRIPITTCTLHYYLDDMVEEIGPTVVVPGSWRAGRHPSGEGEGWNGHRPQMISVKAGGAVLFRHDLWHGAEMNSSTRRRYMIQVHYAEGSRRPMYPPIDFKEYYSAEVLAKATPRQRGLLGEGAHTIFY